jgi:hypothetical protein
MILCDAHVHIYDRFDLDIFFSSAFRNFSRGAEHLGIDDFTAVIFLADWSNLNQFKKLAQRCRDSGKRSDTVSVSSFPIQKTADEIALKVGMDDQQTLYVISGKKIITDENLEVLALCTLQDYPDGKSLHNTVSSIYDSGAIPVIPWAVGKWTGSRGRVLNDLLDRFSKVKFYLCDNRNRPIFWPWPKHFKKADQMGIPILSGSDPLHFAEEADRIGGFGFAIENQIRPESPGRDLLEALRDFSVSPIRYGRLESSGRFFKNQIRMQIFKKKWRKELLK